MVVNCYCHCVLGLYIYIYIYIPQSIQYQSQEHPHCQVWSSIRLKMLCLCLLIRLIDVLGSLLWCQINLLHLDEVLFLNKTNNNWQFTTDKAEKDWCHYFLLSASSLQIRKKRLNIIYVNIFNNNPFRNQDSIQISTLYNEYLNYSQLLVFSEHINTCWDEQCSNKPAISHFNSLHTISHVPSVAWCVSQPVTTIDWL